VPLLDPGLLQRLGALTLRSRRRGAGLQVGERRSIRRGQSQEFADHRPYVPGDDLRFLDWHLYGRLDALWVKLFEEEQDRTVYLLLDTSGSMKGEKLDFARQIAGAIAYVALGHSDRVLVAGLADRLAHYAPARGGRGASTAIFRELESVHPGGRTDLSRALSALPRQRGAGIGLLLTDFLYPEGHEVPLRRMLSRGLELHALHVIAPWELRPAIEGDLLLVDAETGEQVPVTATEAALDRYQATVMDWADQVRDTCHRLGVGYARLLTSEPIDEVVLRDLRRAGVLR